MKEFKIHVGLHRDHMVQVLHDGLKNDSTPETFTVKSSNNAGICIPTQFVQIEPIAAHGQSFHISIWYVSMTGITDNFFVQQVGKEYDEYQETEVLRRILTHLRRRRLLTPFESILSRSRLRLEHPHITQLHHSIVFQGDWKKAEEQVVNLATSGFFDSYLNGSLPFANWKRLRGADADGDVPSPRGGHAMCIDPVDDVIYLFGGWDGEKSFDDFWAYDIREDKWRLLGHTSSEQNAPGARSCHKMVFDKKTGSIYVLGRLSDSDSSEAVSGNSTARSNDHDSSKNYLSEFYRFQTRGVDAGKWEYLSSDTASCGGPSLLFDHQMVMDPDSQILYVFGGRVVDGKWDTVNHSGLFSYSAYTAKWTLLQELVDNSTHPRTVIPPRFGHSMVLDQHSRTLYIFAGQREDKYLSDMYTYDIVANKASELFSDFTAAGGPAACVSQRAVIDIGLSEIYLFCGLMRNSQPGSATNLPAESHNWMFSYSQSPGKWSQIHSQTLHAVSDPLVHVVEQPEEPQPRYAHQVVYHPDTKTFFLHGGNAGIIRKMDYKGSPDAGDDVVREEGKEHRLDDLWQMKLMRTGTEDVIRSATYQIRQQQFREKCEDGDQLEALHFLQSEVSSVVNHDDPTETETFRSLLSYLLFPVSSNSMTPGSPTPSSSSQVHDAISLSQALAQSCTLNTKMESDQATSSDCHYARIHTLEDRFCRRVSANMLRETKDPLEQKLNRQQDLSGTRFHQRSEVFERLMEFVSEGEKQPKESLLVIR